jgi:hypothetical protein
MDDVAAEVAGPTQARQHERGEPELGAHRSRRRLWCAGGLALMVVAGGLAEAAGAFAGSGPVSAADGNPYHTGTAIVRLRSLVSQTQLQATLAEAGSYTVVNQAQGTITALPSVGTVVRRGQALYWVDGSPVALLYGPMPAWRDLAEGVTGADVGELNANLVKLGYASATDLDADSDYFSAATVAALEELQAHLGVAVTGMLPLGQVVFLPTAALITSLGQGVDTGGQAAPGSVVLSASSTRRLVTIALDPSLQGEVKTGEKVSIMLPTGRATPGVVSSVASVATPAAGNADGGITVQVVPTRPAALGHLEQAPVQVTITTASVDRALVVPVDALVAHANGEYAVEVAGRRGHHLVPVSIGLFDDAAGLVQVSGRGLAAGQRVVVPSI